MSELLLDLLRMNLAAAVAVAVVLAARRPVRERFGAQIAYGFWALVPLAAFATLLPARVVRVVVPASAVAPSEAMKAGEAAASAAATSPAALVDPWLVAGILWGAGALLALAALVRGQARFMAAARDGLAGPAALGVLAPRVVTPADFERRYTPREREMILAHERGHIARHDTRINALVALVRCACWFNPMIHLMARRLRVDQELACDAHVVARHPGARRTYAEAMLKTQIAAWPSPIGCHWSAAAAHPLAERIGWLSRPAPAPGVRRAGLSLILGMGALAIGAAWASKPADTVVVSGLVSPAPPALRRTAPSPPSRPERRIVMPAREASNASAVVPTVAPPLAPPDPGFADLEAAADVAVAPYIPENTNPRPAYTRSTHERPARERKVYGVAERSSVQPGSAVRVYATATASDGRGLLTDLTAYGSQRRFRTGTISNSGSRERLFTAVRQEGERLWVKASFSRDFEGPDSGEIEMRSGETREFEVGGRPVSVTATVRPETAEERQGDPETVKRLGEQAYRATQALWAAYQPR